MRIPSKLDRVPGGLEATVDCPKLGEEVDVIAYCARLRNWIDEEGVKNTDFDCPYFQNMEIGAINCSYEETTRLLESV